MLTPTTEPGRIARIKRAELLSSLGAGLLGGGIALLFAGPLGPYAVPLLLLGLISHAVGMYRKHQLESAHGHERIWWAEALYWVCWLGLALLFLVFIVRQL